MTRDKPPAEPSAPDPVGADQTHGLDALVAALEAAVVSGALTFDEALDGLVARTVEAAGATLDPAARADLEAVLRQALASDPALLALRQAHHR